MVDIPIQVMNQAVMAQNQSMMTNNVLMAGANASVSAGPNGPVNPTDFLVILFALLGVPSMLAYIGWMVIGQTLVTDANESVERQFEEEEKEEHQDQAKGPDDRSFEHMMEIYGNVPKSTKRDN